MATDVDRAAAIAGPVQGVLDEIGENLVELFGNASNEPSPSRSIETVARLSPMATTNPTTSRTAAKTS